MKQEYILHYLFELSRAFEQLDHENIDLVISLLNEARMNGNQVFIMGNGGSASTATHFVCDLAKNTRRQNWPLLRVIGLSDNMAIFSAYANDEGYENVFKQQLANLIRPNDLVIAISASGNSKNVLKAVEFANQVKAKTIGFTGYTGGELGPMAQVNINVPSNEITIIEDVHLMLEHLITKRINELADQSVACDESTPVKFSDGAEQDLAKILFGKPVITQGQMSLEKAQSSLSTFYKISQEFADKLDLHNLLRSILKLTLESVGAQSGSIAVLDENGEIIDGAISYDGRVVTSSLNQMAEIIQNGLAGWVVENRRGALVTNTKDDPRWLIREWEDAQTSPRSAISVPLMTHDRVVGVMTLSHPEPGKFSMEDLALLTAITITISYSNISDPNK